MLNSGAKKTVKELKSITCKNVVGAEDITFIHNVVFYWAQEADSGA